MWQFVTNHFHFKQLYSSAPQTVVVLLSQYIKAMLRLSVIAVVLLFAGADDSFDPANSSTSTPEADAPPPDVLWETGLHSHTFAEVAKSTPSCMSLHHCSDDFNPHHGHSHFGDGHSHYSHGYHHGHSHAIDEFIENGVPTWDNAEKDLSIFGKVGVKVRKALPGSIVVTDLINKAHAALFERGFTPANTLFSSSVCPDEINHAYHDLSLIQMFTRTWGESFQMGGLAGIPFAGKTGFGAFSSHVPDNGNLFILFAPHVGITPDGEFGMYAREGQSAEAGHTCGAAVGAHKHIINGGEVLDSLHLGLHPFDYQQQWIISNIAAKMDTINAAENSMVELSKQMYFIIDDFIQHIVSTENVPGAVVLLGGVHINTPGYMEDFFLPMKFEIHRRDMLVVEDMLSELRTEPTTRPPASA